MFAIHRSRVALAVVAIALAGCNNALPDQPAAAKRAQAPVSNGGGQLTGEGGSLYDQPVNAPAAKPIDVPPASAAGGAKPPVVVVPADGTAAGDKPAQGTVLAFVPTALRDQALDAAHATKARISAKMGGVIASPDGKLTLTIPPGALSQDSDVRVAPGDTSHLATPGVYLPGVRFALDLGGAKLAPDAVIRVQQVVDPRFVPELQKRDKAFDPANYGLSKNADGQWVMEMPVRGPASVSPAVPTEPFDWKAVMLAEFGHLPFAPGSPNQPTFKLQATPEEQFQSSYGAPAPKSMDEWFAYEHSGLFDCGSIESNCWGLDLLRSLDWPIGNQSCGSEGSPPPSPNLVRAAVPVEVTYSSDDSNVHGKPAAGSTVTFSLLASALNGPGQVIADKDGKASTFAPEGSAVSAMAAIDLGPRAGAWVNGKVAAGMAPLKLTVEKNSPHVELTFEVSDYKVGPSLEVTYTMDGAIKTQTFQNPDPNAITSKATLIVQVPDDEQHTFAVTNTTGQGVGFKSATPAELKIQRNGVYPVKVLLQPNGSK